MNIGEIIRNLREAKQYGLNELARMADIPSSYISSLEQGKKNNPSLSIITKLFKAMALSEAEIAKILLSLDQQEYTWEKLKEELFTTNNFDLDESEKKKKYYSCLIEITNCLVANGDYLHEEDLQYITFSISNLVDFLVYKNKK